MPDHREHRGPHPRDRELFGDAKHARLREAVEHLTWLLERGYSDDAALKLVGDRFGLTVRQRQAVRRCSCSDTALVRRRAHRVAPEALAGRPLFVDGFNVLIGVECALSGALLLVGRDGAYRDLASVHGTYRTVNETPEAVTLWISATEKLAPSGVHVYLDAPVSNSGRLAELVRAASPTESWSVELVSSPDRLLESVRDGVVASADGVILDECGHWIDLVAWTVEQHRIPCWRLDLRPRDA